MSEPPPPSEELIRLLSRYDLKVGELGLALRAMILEEAPFASERIFETYALALVYSITDKWRDTFCEAAPSSPLHSSGNQTRKVRRN